MHLVTQWWQLQSAGDRASSTSDPCRGALQESSSLIPISHRGEPQCQGGSLCCSSLKASIWKSWDLNPDSWSLSSQPLSSLIFLFQPNPHQVASSFTKLPKPGFKQWLGFL